MDETGTIQLLSQNQIDKTKWDACIDQAPNGLIYAYSWYLDTMAGKWDALVYNNYELVMPLTWKKKFGIKYLYQPFLTAQSGIFGKNITPEIRNLFLNAIPSQYKYIDISLNAGNVTSAPSELTYPRMNYVLSLRKNYEAIYQAYNENTKRNLKKSAEAKGTSVKNIDIEKIIELAAAQIKKQGEASNENMNRFRLLYDLLSKRGNVITYAIQFPSGEIGASAVFFFSHNRAYYILVGNHESGRNTGASHALIDAFIKDNAGKEMFLDFEGSDIPTLAAFYKGFGAQPEVYPALKLNRLPFYLRWLKA